ncbi:MAG TPA: HAMP domain-containing sensor histidine kinase [Streptosporangiaceae bacterium]
MTRRAADPDARMLRRAAVAMAVQTAVAVAIVVAAVGGTTWLLTGHRQAADAHHQLQRAVRSADDVVDPPGNVTLVAHGPDGRTEMSPGAPDDLRHAARHPPRDGFSTIRAGHAHYLVYAGRGAGGRRVVGYLDDRERHDESERLLGALAAAGAVGVAAAAAVGGLVGYRAVRPLGRALAIQRRFVADASHELRTPLTVMHTRTQMLRRHLTRGDPPERLAGDLDRLTQDARNLSEVVDDLLLSAELRAHPDSAEILDLGDLTADTVAAFQPLAGERAATLAADVEDADAGGDRLLVRGVPSALRRALSSLLDNALTHVDAGGRVTASVRRTDGGVTLAVADDGAGLDPGEARHLMERFARGESAAGRGRRFGLGLSLVREVVQAHGGTLTIAGAPGEGATFTVRLPPAAP